MSTGMVFTYKVVIEESKLAEISTDVLSLAGGNECCGSLLLAKHALPFYTESLLKIDILAFILI